MNKWLPVSLFIVFIGAIIGATLYYSPSWGLMDDVQNLKMAKAIVESPNPWHVLSENYLVGGVFRPFYFLWSTVLYYVFQNCPIGIYLFNIVWNASALVFWGVVFFHVFAVKREDYFWTVFFYPLTFFIFTAYWNIYNYISLQEKFIVFFAPLAIYFFQKLYQKLDWKSFVCLYLFIVLGIFSKATFIFIPAIFAAYSLLDLVFFRKNQKASWFLLVSNGIFMAGYVFYTFAVQLKAGYTEKYKSNLELSVYFNKAIHLPFVMKFMLLLGLLGVVVLIVRSVILKKTEASLSALIYLGLAAYVLLLLPWGSQSYLLSATGPLLMGALFPLYAWLNRRTFSVKIILNGTIIALLCFVFMGNIAPNISKMADIGRAISFLKEYAQETAVSDVYFMPPPYSESAYAAEKFTGKKVVFCDNGKITEDQLSVSGQDYVMFNYLFPSIHLSGVRIGEEVFSNSSWKFFKLVREGGHEEDFTVPFVKTSLQRLKEKIRDLR